MKGNVSSWFIHHPVATTLVTVGLVLLGGFAFPRLPIAPLPQAEFPTIQVSARLPGASPDTIASSIATPLEVQLSAVSGITEMTSLSSLGGTQITLQFVLDKNIESAAQEVQSAINAVAGRLPADMPSLPTWKKVNPNDSPILILSVVSEVLPLTELSDIADTLLARQLSQMNGVAEVSIIGQQKPAIRVQASPERLSAYGLTLGDIRSAVQRTSVNQAKGAIYGDGRVSTLATNDQLFDAKQYDRLVVAYKDGAPVLLGDVAKVSFGAENDYIYISQNGKPGLNIVVRRQPDANIVATADRVMAALPALEAQLPATVKVDVLIDRTRTIRSSLHEVELSLMVTIGLVVMIMGLFLRQLSATLIVAVVLMVSLIATLAAMYALGFSLNNLTLVALVISVGFIVDDAIVVIENIHRHLENGKSRVDAALEGSSEIGFTVLSICVSLIAAFIPLLFMGGVVGRLFKEFAMTVSAAILISVPISLTLAPMLASRFMNPLPHHHGGRGRLVALYDRTLKVALAHQRWMLGAFALALALAVVSYVSIPKGFFPTQDTGFSIGTAQAAQDTSFEDMIVRHKAIEKILDAEPAISGYASSIDGSGAGLSSGRFFIALKERRDRDVSITEMADRLRPKLAKIPGVVLFLRATQDINLGGRGARTLYAYALKSGETALLTEWADKLTTKLAEMPQLTDVSNDQLVGASVTRLNIDREAASRFGITTEDIDQTLYDAFGQRQISEYQTDVNQYRIILEITPEQRGKVESLAYFQLRSPLTGQMVPLSTLATIEPPTTGPLSISHNGMFPAVNIAFNLAPGVSLGDAVKLVEEAKTEINMPSSISGNFQGTAQAFQETLASQPILILAALLAVYIILGVLYESFVHPLTILSTLPSAGIGAVLMLWILGHDFTVMALIGIVLLIGIVKKNGIMMVDFALAAEREGGKTPLEAVHEACLVRFRPILMTTLAALLGGIPLMLGGGAGAELRQPLGIAVVGGLLVSQVLTLYTTPVIYLTLDRIFHRRRAPAAQPAEMVTT